MFRDNVSIAVRPSAWSRLAPTLLFALAAAVRAVPAGAQPSDLACNAGVVEDGVAALMEQAADKRYAVGKVDLVGHSMGGILSRLYVQGQYYGDDVRRIVTCNTPHAGSQMANWLLDEIWDPYGLACAAIGATTGSCYNGAVCDLNVYSYGIHNLLNKPFSHPGDVQVHALSTVSDITSPLQGPIPSFLSTSYVALIQSVVPFCALPDLFDDIFKGEENDAVVALPSQVGGLEGTKTSVFENQIHVGSTANPAVIDRVRNLLNEPKNSSSFTDAGYAPPNLNYNTPTSCTIPQLVTAEAVTPASLTASAPPVASTTPFCLGGRSACCATANHAPASLRALAATLQALSVYPPALHLDPAKTGSLEITGSYSDGIDRDLSQVPGMAFAFAEGNASRSGTNGVTLNARLDDLLTITYQDLTAPQVNIRALPEQQPRLPKGTVRRHLRRT